ncbi:hypothetical protein [Microbispora sp. NPDC049125]|uniref:hypothetical protein n=1 Tax=Microbispora sp. NPDC049125 TaxID=3154929 RepID=UPI003465F37C
MRALPPLLRRTALMAVILLGSALAAAGVLFATGPVTGPATARGTVPEHMAATVIPLCPHDTALDRPAR